MTVALPAAGRGAAPSAERAPRRRRYLDAVVETAGIANLAGFNDDTRAFLSIPARHTLWRRAAADWVAELHVRRPETDTDGLSAAATPHPCPACRLPRPALRRSSAPPHRRLPVCPSVRLSARCEERWTGRTLWR